MKEKWKKKAKTKNGKMKKKMKNEKRIKTKKKLEKLMKKERKMRKIGFHFQNPQRFPGFTVVVVVTFSVKNPRRFPCFFGMCLFPEENQQPVLRVHRFQTKSDNYHWTWNKNTHFTDENQRRKFSLRSAPLSIIILLKIIQSFNNNKAVYPMSAFFFASPVVEWTLASSPFQELHSDVGSDGSAHG